MAEAGRDRDPHERGSNGIGTRDRGSHVAFFATLPGIYIAMLYLFITIYAIVRAIGPGSGENPG